MNEEMKMLVKDYDSYMSENSAFFDRLKENDSLMYFKIEDVLKALNSIKDRYTKGEPLQKEEIALFSIGMEYLYDYKLTVEAFEKRLACSIDDVSAIIDLAIDLDDYMNDFDEVDEDAASLYDELEKTIFEGLELDEDLYLRIEKILSNADYISILDCFRDYVDELNII